MGAPAGNQYALGNEGGRPTKLTPELLEKARGYLKWCEEHPIHLANKYSKDGELLQEVTCERLPSVAGLARHLDIGRSTIYFWSKENKEFQDILESVNVEQEKQAVELGHAGKSNALMAKFLLSAKHDYREKSDITTAGKELPSPIVSVQRNLSDEKNTRDEGKA